MSDSPTPAITVADPPFDKPNADLILLSSDDVEFRVFKVFLSTASPFFESMFTLPQPVEAESSGVNDTKDGLPIIRMEESSDVIEGLLMFLYPSWGPAPSLKTLERVQFILEATLKYDMEGVRNRIQQMMVAPRFFEDELGHLRVFGIAFRYQFEEVAMVAMRQSRKYSILGQPYVKELDHISPKAYHQLLDYHWRCSVAAVAAATSFDWVPSLGWNQTEMIPDCKKCSGFLIPRRSGKISPSKYWTNYMERARIALKDRPCGASVLSHDLIDKAKQDAKKCLHCYTSAGVMMWHFTEILAEEIEKVTSAVKPKLDF